MGGTPILALALVGMPINVLPPATIREILRGGESVCADAGIPIAGGHSIDSVEAIYGLVALGLAHPDAIKRNSTAQRGDVLVLGKPIGVGVLSAALKKNALDAARYRTLIETTTRLNRPGPKLAAHAGVHAIRLDTTDRDGFVRAADEAREVFGAVHLLANNAGVGIPALASECSYQDWDWAIDVNINGVFNGIRNTAVTGERKFQLSPDQYKAFAGQLAPYRPASGEVRYSHGEPNCKQAVTDMPSVDVRWTRAIGDSQALMFYFGCDMEKNRAMADALGGAIEELPLEPLIGERP
jgi:hypothetical protein